MLVSVRNKQRKRKRMQCVNQEKFVIVSINIHIFHACIGKVGESSIKEVIIQTPDIESMTQRSTPIMNIKQKGESKIKDEILVESKVLHIE
jgi:hypothetical protein